MCPTAGPKLGAPHLEEGLTMTGGRRGAGVISTGLYRHQVLDVGYCTEDGVSFEPVTIQVNGCGGDIIQLPASSAALRLRGTIVLVSVTTLMVVRSHGANDLK